MVGEKTGQQLLPFEIDRSRKTSLTEQLVLGFSDAIDRGLYPDGATLPSLRELVRQTGVSLISARRAYSRLAADGRIVQIQGVGTVARASGRGLWRGHVLIVGYGHGENFFSNVVGGAVRECFYADGWLVTSVQVPKVPRSAKDCLELVPVLRRSYDLILTLSDEPVVYRMLAKTSSRLVAFYHMHKPPRGRFTAVRFDWDSALARLAADQVAKGVRTVWEVAGDTAFASSVSHFRSRGASVERIALNAGSAESMMEEAVRVVLSRLDAAPRWPDLLYFTDDFRFVACTAALLHRGVKIPRDVRLASWSNAGMGPILPVSFAAVVCDARQCGLRLFNVVQKLLTGKSVAQEDLVVSIDYQSERKPI